MRYNVAVIAILDDLFGYSVSNQWGCHGFWQVIKVIAPLPPTLRTQQEPEQLTRGKPEQLTHLHY